jgi:WD40 repeat protein
MPPPSAWVFSTDDPEKLSDALVDVSWAGFTDGEQVLTVRHGQLVFWEEGPRTTDTRATFKPTGQVLPQAGMEWAIFSKDGSRLATWSEDGEVVVWDTSQVGTGAPIRE